MVKSSRFLSSAIIAVAVETQFVDKGEFEEEVETGAQKSKGGRAAADRRRQAPGLVRVSVVKLNECGQYGVKKKMSEWSGLFGLA